MALPSHLGGHDVKVCVPPDFREWVESPGIPVPPISPERRRFAASRPTATQPQTPLTSAQRRPMMEATVAAQFEALTSATQEGDVIVALPRYRWAARSVRLSGIPYVAFAAYAPVVLPSRIMHHRPCLPYLDRLPPTTTTTLSLWGHRAWNRERF